MEVVAVQAFGTSLSPLGGFSPQANKQAIESVILSKTVSLGAGNSDAADAGVADVFKALNVTAKEVVDKLNELLKADLPNGLESLNPDEVTPEATAERIVSGATSYFEVFKRQNPNLSDEELLTQFLKTISGGIDQGYNDAVQILEGLGAFQFDGVKDGVDKTRVLIDEKLAAFEAFKRKELGLTQTDAGAAAAQLASTGTVAQAGTAVARTGGLNVTA